MDIFTRFIPFIQDYIYEHNWKNLRPIQVGAAETIFNNQDSVLLVASTASGKAEAAFFPILTDLYKNSAHSVGVLYTLPLKVLINSQYGRLTDPCQDANAPARRWHDEVAQAQKRKLLKRPSGILQITPEPLRSLMINKHMDIPSLFHDLRYAVIDELRSFL